MLMYIFTADKNEIIFFKLLLPEDLSIRKIFL